MRMAKLQKSRCLVCKKETYLLFCSPKCRDKYLKELYRAWEEDDAQAKRKEA